MRALRSILLLLCTLMPDPRLRAAGTGAPLPDGVRAAWDSAKAHRETTPTRERICLNGLWRWQPAEVRADALPKESWGYFKVPGCWPGIEDYMQKDSQTVFAHPDWKVKSFGDLSAAWYQREMTIPREWAGRRIAVSAEYLNSYAAVFVDGAKAGEIHFPAGELDLTQVCKPGATQVLSVLVAALPMKGILLSYTDSAAAREVKGSVARRGLCGDVFLTSTPSGPRVAEVKVDTSVRRKEITFGAALENLADGRYSLRARIVEGGRSIKEFTSAAFQAADLKSGRMKFTEKWMAEKLWDTHTPQNMLGLELSLVDAGGKALDVHWMTRFGFREMWIEGRDFFLNGTRIHLSVVPLDNAQLSAAQSTCEAARETMERLQSFGINFVYTHNYDCEPGAHLSFAEILRAADDTGMLVALTQPHFSGYDWKAADAAAKNGYARHAAFYARVAQDHPSVVMYAMSHNATGYEEDMNPDMIDGVQAPRDNWSANNVKQATQAEAIVRGIDPGRIVYHHASGNLGTMHVMNFYPNMVPIQELSDWFGHWSAKGVKPAYMCEYGAPFTWDWTLYRGWYKGKREFGSARVPWEFCVAEWNAQLFGDAAYAISEPEKQNLRWEAKQFRDGSAGWHRWDYPAEVGSARFTERYPLFARYLTDNWRGFRGWGVSAISPWEYGHYWKLRDGMNRQRENFKTDWDSIQRPGFSPDFIEQPMARMDVAYQRTDWVATPAADALLRNNQPLLAWIAGAPAHFTEKGHHYFPGETVAKQIIVINDSRVPVSCDCQWSGVAAGSKKVTVIPGGQERVPLSFALPTTLAPGAHELSARFVFSTGVTQTDRIPINVLPRPQPVAANAKIALFDPKGETRALLEKAGVRTQPVQADTDLSPFDILIVGKAALTPAGAAPNITGVREGLKVILFEQTPDVLEQRFGFRIAEYGLRQVFARVPGHPLLAGLTTETLHDWCGAATIQPPQLSYELRPMFGPTVKWCGLPVPRLWRCGNHGNVASVLIEKPAHGDFLPILDGGFSLQYSPLMEYREGRGMVLFCQTDVTARTESDPAAETLARNILEYVANWKPSPWRQAIYTGEPAGRKYLEAAGLPMKEYAGGKLSPDEVLIAGHGARAANVAEYLKAGGHLLAVGIDQVDADALLPFKVGLKHAEYIAASFTSHGPDSLLAGIGPAEVHNRDPRELPLIASGAMILGDGVLAQAENANVAFCQLAPWQFDGSSSNLRRTRRHSARLLSRLLANMGVAAATPLLERFHHPVAAKPEQRWLTGFYLDQPEEWDDPYRFFRW